jgi:hypothetical protein
MPATALQDFNEDAARVRALIAHADSLPRANPAEQSLRSDVLRSAWMFAVGALDAYFSDAYTDVVAATIISKSRHDPMTLPNFFYDIRFPVRAVLESYAVNVALANGGAPHDGPRKCLEAGDDTEAVQQILSQGASVLR